MKENDAFYSNVKVGDTILPITPNILLCASASTWAQVFNVDLYNCNTELCQPPSKINLTCTAPLKQR